MTDITRLIDWIFQLAPGLGVSLLLTVSFLAVGIPLGIILGLGLRLPFTPVRYLSIFVVEVARGIPALVMLYIFYFGLPSVQLLLDAFSAAAFSLGVGFAGYTAPIFRAGFEAVPTQQGEAARALALSKRVIFFHVELPQALRIITPPVLGYVISFMQATSLAFAIGVAELMSRAYSVALANFAYLEVFMVVGVIYVLISLPLVHLAESLSGSTTKRRKKKNRPPEISQTTTSIILSPHQK